MREDTGWNLAAAKAIGTALEDFRGPDRPFNVAVLPDDSGGLYVYVYPAQLKTDVYPLGADEWIAHRKTPAAPGHHRTRSGTGGRRLEGGM